MKIFISLIFIISLSFSESYLISDIPLPKTYIFNLDDDNCNQDCLNNYIQQGYIFSFLANINNDNLDINDQNISEYIDIYTSIFNIDILTIPKKLNIALLLPYKYIGKYATSVTNATFSYLITRNSSFKLKSYNIDDESSKSLKKALEKMLKERYYYVVAPLSLDGAKNLIKLNPKLHIYLPTVHKSDLNSTNKNIIFGGIDYKQQSKELLTQTKPPLVIFYSSSKRAKMLSLYQKNIYLDDNFTFQDPFENNLFFVDSNDTINIDNIEKTIKTYFISSNKTNLESILKDNEYIKYSTVIINTPIVKTGMILSQLTLYETKPYAVLSTQINYSPLIFSITQYQDRKNMLIANSITINQNIFTQTNSLLGNDILYDWINYSTTIGIDYFYANITSSKRKYNIPIKENQVIYPIEFVMPGVSKFKKVKISYKPLSDTNQTSDLEDL